jgi:thiamine pyrophosphate-dependent acetolactate synthase large subunit-like protein
VREFAERTNLGVVNTWGLKGLFRWDSPFHLGTAGLQERDFELAGVNDVDVVIGIGLDDDESPRELLGPLVEVAVADLDSWARRLGRASAPPARPALYTDLAAAVQPLYALDAVPLNPARAAGDLASVLPNGGVVVADPGPAGLWVARTFPTTALGSVIVPARVTPMTAVAIAADAAAEGRPAIAITNAPIDDAARVAIDTARRVGRDLVVEVWGSDGPVSSPAERIDRLSAAIAAGGVHVLDVPVDFSYTRVLVEVAGPVRAWTRHR